MIRKIFRLSGEDIKSFFMERRLKKENEMLTIIFKKNKLDHSRFCVKPILKIFKKATKRNRVKRRIYSIIGRYLKEERGKEKIRGKDFLIFVKNEAVLTKKFSNLKDEVISLIENV